MPKIFYCDLLYNDNGHFDDDFHVLNELSSNRLEHLKINILNLSYFEKRKFFKELFKKKERIVIASTSYLYLFYFSLLFHNFNYILQIHFVPVNRRYLYKYLFKIFIKKVNRISVLSQSVKLDLIGLIGKKYESKIIEIHTRNIVKKQKLRNNVISIVGAVNSARDYSIIFKLLESRNYGNIKFRFYSKGIEKYIKEIDFINKENNDITIVDKYLTPEEYKQAFVDSDFVIISQSKSYGVRFSGVMFDALGEAVSIIANDNISFSAYIDKYKCGFIYKDIDSLNEILEKINSNYSDCIEFDKSLYEDFSIQNNKQLIEKGFVN